MQRAIPWVFLSLLLFAPAAHADRARALTCAASLQPHARMVFDAVFARPQPTVALRSVIEARVRELVFSDRLMMNAARPAAEAASQCLRISRDCTADNC